MVVLGAEHDSLCGAGDSLCFRGKVSIGFFMVSVNSIGTMTIVFDNPFNP